MLKLGMSVPDNKNIPHLLKTIKEAGFQCIMAARAMITLNLLKKVDFCREHGINIMVAHTTFGNIIPTVSEIGFERFDRLNDYAEEKGV